MVRLKGVLVQCRLQMERRNVRQNRRIRHMQCCCRMYRDGARTMTLLRQRCLPMHFECTSAGPPPRCWRGLLDRCTPTMPDMYHCPWASSLMKGEGPEVFADYAFAEGISINPKPAPLHERASRPQNQS